MLNQRRATMPANIRGPFLAPGTVICSGAYLDQFVSIERTVRFREDRRSQAVVADHDHGLQRMRSGFQFSSFRCRQFIHC